MIQAAQKDEPLLEDIRLARNRQPDDLHVWWLGQSGFLICAQGKALLFDPYLSDSLTRKYAETDKPHERMTEQVIAPERLDFIDTVASTHSHTDHLDAETLLALRKSNPQLAMVIPEANRQFVAERLKTDPAWPFGLDADQSIEVDGIRLTGFPAAHNEIDLDQEGRCKYMGYLARIGPWSVYHSGDTRPIAGLAEMLRAYKIDVAFLPINGSLEERRVAGNLWGQEAAALAHNAGVRYAIPCHFELFTFNTETPAAFEEACQWRGQDYRVLRAGERFTLSHLK